jgi:hypothetical protein
MSESRSAEDSLEKAIHECGRFERLITAELFNIPIDNARRNLSFLYILTARDHFKAIIHLLDDGEFRHSAFALVRPVAEAAFRAIWIAHFATDEEIAVVRKSDKAKIPSPKHVAALMKDKFEWPDDGMAKALSDDWSLLCGYVHTGSKQLQGRIKSLGIFPYAEALQMLMTATTYLWLGVFNVATATGSNEVALKVDAAYDKLWGLVGLSPIATDIHPKRVN